MLHGKFYGKIFSNLNSSHKDESDRAAFPSWDIGHCAKGPLCQQDLEFSDIVRIFRIGFVS